MLSKGQSELKYLSTCPMTTPLYSHRPNSKFNDLKVKSYVKEQYFITRLLPHKVNDVTWIVEEVHWEINFINNMISITSSNKQTRKVKDVYLTDTLTKRLVIILWYNWRYYKLVYFFFFILFHAPMPLNSFYVMFYQELRRI